MENLHRSEFFCTAGFVIQPETNSVQVLAALFLKTGDYNSSRRFEIYLSDSHWKILYELNSHRRFMTSNLGSVISSMAYRKPSRPKPESFTPPYGMWSIRKLGTSPAISPPTSNSS
jgi:hypothetical protein